MLAINPHAAEHSRNRFESLDAAEKKRVAALEALRLDPRCTKVVPISVRSKGAPLYVNGVVYARFADPASARAAKNNLLAFWPAAKGRLIRTREDE